VTRAWLRHQSIRVRLMALTAITSTGALLLACAAFWSYESVLYLQTLRRDTLTIAQMLADSSAAALTFDDAKATREVADTLHAEPRVEQACFYDQAQRVIGAYRRNGEEAKCPASPEAAIRFHLSWKQLFVFYPVTVNGESAGTVFLKVGLAEMYSRSFRYGLISAIVLCLAGAFAMILSSRLQRVISDPILHLARVAREVSGAGNYGLRAVKTYDDETGILIDQFNAMMEAVSLRDQQLKQAQDELELRVDERTRSLTREIAERRAAEQSLVNAKLAAEEANAAKSTFLANMSHELRTPLNAILGYSEMLDEDATLAGNETASADLKRIQAAGKHLLALVTDILDISKIEAGAILLQLERAGVVDITDGIASTVTPLMRKNLNRFEIHAAVSGYVLVDPVKFRQCLLNLLSNACKFTEHGLITLSVERREEEGRETFCWSVSDTGIGIAADDIRLLFQPFSQVDSSSTRRHGGTGLGLAISQRLCQLMGGRITVESTPGQGSTFTIYMPGVA
jgi:signal transduction histidine kinase